jgi:hypothetical protein
LKILRQGKKKKKRACEGAEGGIGFGPLKGACSGEKVMEMEREYQ